MTVVYLFKLETLSCAPWLFQQGIHQYIRIFVRKDVFSSAAAVVDTIPLNDSEDDVIDAMTKLLYGTSDIFGATDTKLWEIDQAVSAALHSLEA